MVARRLTQGRPSWPEAVRPDAERGGENPHLSESGIGFVVATAAGPSLSAASRPPDRPVPCRRHASW